MSTGCWLCQWLQEAQDFQVFHYSRDSTLCKAVNSPFFLLLISLLSLIVSVFLLYSVKATVSR